MELRQPRRVLNSRGGLLPFKNLTSSSATFPKNGTRSPTICRERSKREAVGPEPRISGSAPKQLYSVEDSRICICFIAYTTYGDENQERTKGQSSVSSSGKGGVVGEAPVIEYNDRLDTKIRMSRTSVPTLYLFGGRQTIGGDRTSRPSARRGQRDHERSWARRVFISSLHTSRSKVHEEGHPSCQARTGKNSCVHTALLQTARLHTNALRQ